MTLFQPIKEDSYLKALDVAIQESLERTCFIYLFRNNRGYYIIDIIGELFSDEKLILKLYKGERQ
jgi:hypothetical protein